MKREFDFAPSFIKKAGKLLQKNPSLDSAYEVTLNKLLDNPFESSLHTHPLSGELENRYACSVTYKIRIVFRLYDNIVHLLDIGSHDEVY